MSLGILLDLFIGDPKSAYHPIALLGRVISFFEVLFYTDGRRKLFGGFFYLFIVLCFSLLIQLPLFFLKSWPAYLYLGFWVYFLLCGKTLRDAGYRVVEGLEEGVEEGRAALSHYVGRSTASLSEEQILKGTLETMAENTADGIVGPLVYLFLGYLLGVPLLFMAAFKITNTLDSMVGYRNEKYHDFGYVSAKMDDLLGLIPARLTALFFLFAGVFFILPVKKAWRIYLRDRKKHLSPNAGQSEAAVAGLLGIQLGGTHCYGNNVVEKPTLGDDDRRVEASMVNLLAKLLFFVEACFLPLSLLLEVL